MKSNKRSRFHNLGLHVDGTVVAWGFNNHGQLGNGSMIDPIGLWSKDIHEELTRLAMEFISMNADFDDFFSAFIDALVLVISVLNDSVNFLIGFCKYRILLGGLNIKMCKRFMKNFGLSLVVYFVFCVASALCLLLLNITTRVPNVVTDPPRNAPLWVEIILWLHVLGSIILYFYFGAKVKRVGSHLLNYLSVSGSLVLWILLILLSMYFNPYLIVFGGFSFIRLIVLLSEWINNEYILISIASIIPTIIIWLGMLYKDRVAFST